MAETRARGVGLVFVLGALMFGGGAFIAYGEWRRAEQFIAHNTSVEGTLDPSYTEKNGNYELTFYYNLGGKQYQGRSTVGWRPSQREVTVHYDPADPAKGTLDPERDRNDARRWTFLTGAAAVVLAVMAVVNLARGRSGA